MADVADTAPGGGEQRGVYGAADNAESADGGDGGSATEKKSRFNGDYRPHAAILTCERVKAGEFEKAPPYIYAVDAQEGSQKRLNWSKSPRLKITLESDARVRTAPASVHVN